MSKALKIVAVLVLAAAALTLGLYLWHVNHPPVLPPAAKAQPPSPPPPSGPRNPLPVMPTERPLPPLGASDVEARAALESALGPGALERLVFDDFIRRVVATVDNLPREEYAARLNPVKPVGGLPKTSGAGDTLTWSAENSKRYAPFMAALDSVSVEPLVAFYLRYYPLFQQAYVELGYPQGYFNDRLVEVIDHLLDAPEAKGPIRLVQPKVLLQFADPDLQQLSAGQKVMVRLGPENAAKVKAKLREIRSRVALEKP